MSHGTWSWVGASTTGTSHLAAGTGCDDAGACIQINSPAGQVLICAVSDGAGSASHSSVGSRTAVRSFCRSALAFVRAGGEPSAITKETAGEWIDEVRDRIALLATRRGLHRRSFAATLVGCVAGEGGLSIIHVGDGACTLRMRGDAAWLVPSWPAQGEFAGTTYFLTDDPEPLVTVKNVEGQVAEVAVFTDGLERLALDFGNREAFTPFFSSMIKSLSGNLPGRDRPLSANLLHFLGSSAITDRTDDDKTLIMAKLK